jgi:hypothetical protein
VRHARRVLGELHGAEDRADALADLGGGPLALHQAEGHVVEHAQVREHRVVLEHHADRALVGAQVADRLALEQDLAGVQWVKAGDRAQQRGLAAAARAEQREECAARDVDADVLQRDMRAIGLADVPELDMAHGRPSASGRITSC